MFRKIQMTLDLKMIERAEGGRCGHDAKAQS